MRTPSRIRRIVKICEVVELFLCKPFWFFLSMLSILGYMGLQSRALYILAVVDVSVIPSVLSFVSVNIKIFWKICSV